jgi:predicted N-acetyltransferase YhbS
LPIKRVTTRSQADDLNKANRRRQILPVHLGREDTVRLYAAYDGTEPVGWVSSIPVQAGNWVSNLYVARLYRGQGIGRALMTTMLEDDNSHGAEWSVLLASGDGARLYPHVGYARIGTLQLFVPGDVWRDSR